MTSSAPVDVPDHLAQERRLLACQRLLQARGAALRLQPLAAHLGTQGLIRAQGPDAPPLRRVDPETVRAALERLLSRSPDQAGLLLLVAVEGAGEDVVAAELGIPHGRVLTETHKALAALARSFEDVAYSTTVSEPEPEPRLGLAAAARARSASRRS